MYNRYPRNFTRRKIFVAKVNQVCNSILVILTGKLDGISCRPQYYETFGGCDYETCYSQTEKLLTLDNIPTAILEINDFAAVGAMNCIQEHGFSVPEDISVVGYDNTQICSMVTPKLTSIDYNYDDFAEKLIATVEGIYSTSSLPPLQLIEPSLIIRGSTGTARES